MQTDVNTLPFGDRAWAWFVIASCLDAQGKATEALASYKDIADRHANENVALPARLAMARLYEAQGKLTDARDTLEAIGRTNPNTAAGSEARARYVDLL